MANSNTIINQSPPSRRRYSGMSVEEEYNTAAHQYDQKWDKYTKETLEPVLDRAIPFLEKVESASKDGTVQLLDIGSGTGAFAFQIQSQFPEWNIACLDPSTEMLHQAKQKPWPCSDKVEFVKCGSNALPFPVSSRQASLFQFTL
jgi:ubiquinone/menaquinone biosynthesis C-methylase UbiE